MTSFRRLVIGTTEFFLVISIFVFTFFSGVAGAALGRIYLTTLNATQIQFSNSSSILVGTAVGASLGGLIGFVSTASAAAITFALSQIERNTRCLVPGDWERSQDRAQHLNPVRDFGNF